MLRIFIFLAVVFLLGLGFSWVADNPGLVTITLPNQEAESVGKEIEVSLMVAVVAITAIITTILVIWSIIQTIWRSPEIFTRWRKGRRRERGYSVLSHGMIAAAAGDASTARKLTSESRKLLTDEPLVALLDAQTALLENKREVAQASFETMLEKSETRLLGLRGLYVEAERQGEKEAAAHYAERAMELAPEAPWAGTALLRHQSTSGDWEGALRTLETIRRTNNLDNQENNRLKAVLQTARAMDMEDSSPEEARTLALSAHKLAPSLVPATVIAARISSRLGNFKKASKVLETTWKLEPHPEIAEAYVHVRSGDSAIDRLKRARVLAGKRQNHVEGSFAVADAAIDARDWQTARDALASILRSNPTERACLLMADIEESEHGDKGRMRDWLSRAVRAPRDPAWTADGYVSEDWAPTSPISGKLDAFVWKVPVELLGVTADSVDYSQFATEPLPDEPVDTGTLIEAIVPTSDQHERKTAEIHIDNTDKSSLKSETTEESTVDGGKSEDTISSQTQQNAEDIDNGRLGSEGDTSQPDTPIVPDDPGVDEPELEETKPGRFRLF